MTFYWAWPWIGGLTASKGERETDEGKKIGKKLEKEKEREKGREKEREAEVKHNKAG